MKLGYLTLKYEIFTWSPSIGKVFNIQKESILNENAKQDNTRPLLQSFSCQSDIYVSRNPSALIADLNQMMQS